MAGTINLDEDLYRELGQYGNRDESWNDIVARVLEHVDEEAAREDRENRITTFENEEPTAGNPAVQALDDGTVVRHKYTRGPYEGTEVEATVRGGKLEYNGERWSPSGAAREADRDVRGSDARDSGYRGPTWWEYENENGEWAPLNTATE
jgi:hypothetical protein